MPQWQLSLCEVPHEVTLTDLPCRLVLVVCQVPVVRDGPPPPPVLPPT